VIADSTYVVELNFLTCYFFSIMNFGLVNVQLPSSANIKRGLTDVFLIVDNAAEFLCA